MAHLKEKCTSEPEAREFLREYGEEIQEKYDLYILKIRGGKE